MLTASSRPWEEKAALGANTLFAGLYQELHRLARRQLSRSPAEVTLSPTTLLHEAYLNMARREGPAFPDRARFMAYAARVMRGLIIDYARGRSAHKRGGGKRVSSLVVDVAESMDDSAALEQIGEALDRLATLDPPLAEVVDLKFFGGLSIAEIAALRGTCARTVQRQWEKARIYLHGLIRDERSP